MLTWAWVDMDNLLRDPVLVFALNKHDTLDTPQEKHLHDSQQCQHENMQRTSMTKTRWHGGGPDNPAWRHGSVGKILLSACSMEHTHDLGQCILPTCGPQQDGPGPKKMLPYQRRTLRS